jgi:hypothetical protein
MAEVKLTTREKNFFQFRPPIFDFEFSRNDREILLAFSARKEVERDLRVRLYETRSRPTRAERSKLLSADQEQRLLLEGFSKSNRFVEADGQQTVAQIAAAHGFDSDEPVLAHFANRLLQQTRGSQPQQGDMVFIPQLRSLDAIALGPVLPVEDVSESIPDGGHRHQARWNIDQLLYDPLDPSQWVPDSLITLGPSKRVVATVFDEEQRQIWLPQFAVLTAAGAFLAASPTPPEIVEEAGYALDSEDPDAFAVLVGKGSRALTADSSSVTFQAKERPLGAYGAVIAKET